VAGRYVVGDAPQQVEGIVKGDLLYCEKCKDRDRNCPHCHDAFGNKTSEELWRGMGGLESDRLRAKRVRRRL
jgi:hypothetical protein